MTKTVLWWGQSGGGLVGMQVKGVVGGVWGCRGGAGPGDGWLRGTGVVEPRG